MPTDYKPVTDEDIRMAYLSLLLSGRKFDNLDLAVTQELLRLNRLTADKSLPRIVAASSRIKAVISAIQFEERTSRYLITFQPLNGDGVETIRSERTDGNRGDAVKLIWNRDLIGHDAIIFKHNEIREGDSKNANGFRVAPYCIDLGKRK